MPVVWDTHLQEIVIIHDTAVEQLPSYALEGATALRNLTGFQTAGLRTSSSLHFRSCDASPAWT